MKIRKGDTVKVIAGNDRGKTGKVLSVSPSAGRLLVEGINLRTKHVRSRRQGQKGEVVKIPLPVPIARLAVVCPHCAKPTRVGMRAGEKGKVRVCKKCGGEI